MPEFETYFYGLSVAVAMAVIAWIVSLVKRDVSIVDSVWSLFFFALCATYYWGHESTALRGALTLILVAVWALRLSAYITWRNWGQGEDSRYQAIRRNNSPGFAFKSLWIVFLLQGTLAWIISLPLFAAVTGTAPIGVLDLAAAMLVLFGLFFESVADAQLAAFKSRPTSEGRVMQSGLWRYTRHPNYFGEFCVWWGFFLFSLSTGAWWAVLSPVLMTFLLLRVSGIVLLEKDIADRRPGYREYAERTNAFFPWMPKTPNASVGETR